MLFLSCKGDGTSASDKQTSQGILGRANFESYIEVSWNKKNMDTLQSLLVEDFICRHNGIRVVDDRSEMQAFMNVYFTGFPDARIETDTLVVNKGQLSTHWTFNGTHTGTFRQLRPTGKKVRINGHAIVSFDSKGKIVREDVYYNELEFLQQLGYTLNPPILK
ncbi:conserved hypothetical protein, steroid delta-isomerase-related [Pseudozobellia thermophila]|uniref:SnoaL-like polyketide cyclase n=2 Tax=Pseudozobellia thermophila TaxID=192903 RepID=A0A1M6HDC5_9FLAO|nr:conserved hypothetical protein, steroid delta-isomerase-related [Pseudozobellia thermophila]